MALRESEAKLLYIKDYLEKAPAGTTGDVSYAKCFSRTTTFPASGKKYLYGHFRPCGLRHGHRVHSWKKRRLLPGFPCL